MIHIRRIVASGFKQLTEVDLVLPSRGRFLVQGGNEAGKSTLFEAVFFALFGRPLVTETGYARLDDCIRYSDQEAWVAVDVDLGDRTLSISRRLRRGRPNVWELDVRLPDDRVEHVRGNSVVNDRIAAELKLDGDALLNTCFVEQKKLEKLEGQSRVQREQSLLRLLNLDRLVDVRERLRVRQTDTAHVERFGRRAELARTQEELPGIESRHRRAVADLACAETRDAVVRALREEQQLAELRARAAEASRRAQDLRRAADELRRLRAGEEQLRQARAAAERAADSRARATEAESEATAARRAADEEVPRILRHGRAVRRVQDRVARLAALRGERDELRRTAEREEGELVAAAAVAAELAEVRRRLVEARATVRESAEAADDLAADARGFQVRDALAAWSDAHAATAAPADGDALERARAAEADAARRQRIETVAIVAVLLAAALGGMAWRPLWVVSVALAVVLAWRQQVHGARSSRLAAEIGRLQGEADLRAREAHERLARAAAADAHLSELNVVRPADRARAAAAVAEIDARLAGRTRVRIDQDLADARARRARAEADVQDLDRRETELAAAVAARDTASLAAAVAARHARAGRLDAALERLEPKVEARAAELSVAAEASAIASELGALRSDLAAARAAAERAPALAEAAAAAHTRAAEHMATARAAWSGLPDVEGVPPWPADAVDAPWTEAAAALDSAIRQVGGDAVERAAEEAGARAQALAGELTAAERTHAATARDVRVRLHAMALAPGGPDLSLAESPAREDLEALRDALGALVTADVPALVVERDRLQERLNVARHEIRRLSAELSHPPAERIDREAAEREHDEARRSLEVRRRAEEMVEQAGTNIMHQVLPSTIEHMRRLLPTLTEGRYFDAQLGDDFRIEVYDDRARAWKQKNIFSGGTRDQFSLALRLAFALATLPAERGAAPSFVFLDEPLSAFDAGRARALVDLLVEGEVAASFDQIFLISHVPVDRELFDYRIVMEAGRVVETNLLVPEAQA